MENKIEKMVALFDGTGKQLSRYWRKINDKGILEEKSEYYLAQNKNNKWAIFHINNPDTPISNWWYIIREQGLVLNQSEYYIAVDNDYNEAIFHRDNPNAPISKWWDMIIPVGIIIDRKVEYYLVKIFDKKRNTFLQAIFHKNNPDEPISDWEEKFTEKEIEKIIENYEIEENKLKKTFLNFNGFDLL